MSGIPAALWAESLKVRKSRMLWITVIAAIFMALMMGFLMFISKNPELAAKMGLLGTKSSMVQNVDWPSYMNLLAEMIAALGILGSGFVTAWAFGREYSDRTIKDLLALPTSRADIVLSKFVVVIAWSLLLALVLLACSLAVGWAMGLAGWSGDVASQGISAYVATTLLTLVLCSPVAFFASYGRGYLAPIGFVIIMVVVAEFIATIGLGPYFPWAVPGLYGVATGGSGDYPGMISYVIMALAGLAGLAATFAWWRYADQF